ncbi:MAG: metal-dependent hydrolase, partial [Deltaproteobacteria bacterium]|nr:metal-dependent hydrolase [Deltaproteobacteria bacterium]
MDPICHTMVGAALASTGLERKTRFGRATLIIGANLPDVDVFSYAWGEIAALEFRRGVTHGIPALVVLPLLLAGAMTGADRLFQRGREPAVDFGWLLALSAISVISHPMLDFLNVYGVRWLMPFDDTWFYGDILYIVDPWMWAILGSALIAALWWRNREASGAFARPARVGLLVALAYVIAMAAGESVSRRVVEASLSDTEMPRLMIAPVPVDPFRRTVVIDGERDYRLGVVNLLPRPSVQFDTRRIPKGESAAARLAAATRDGQAFLRWARFPFFEVDDSNGEPVVYIIDARYTLDRDAVFGSVRIPLPGARS